MELISVLDEEFKLYGKVIEGYDYSGLIEEMEKVATPEGVDYVASVPALEALPIAREIANGIYGQMPIQIGYCNGHNLKLNGLEYHRDSELNLAVTDMVLMLGLLTDVTADFTYDTSKVKAFFVPKGMMVEVYATTLHYAPCHTVETGFSSVVVLPKGTNEDLVETVVVKCGEERLLTARNKWLLGHAQGGCPQGTVLGLIGENITL
ncbi:MAG: DUF4867 family protein [Lachnospiraceae bacterium]